MKRLFEFDIVRGILLLMMIVDHSPSVLRTITDQPLGFFTAAEGFVFVSAFLAGMLFRRRAESRGFDAARSSSIQRAWRIYRGHLLTLAFAFVIGSLFLGQFPGIRNLLDRYLENPLPAMIGSAVLLFRPPLMDILPMYILFSLLTPLVFSVAQRSGWKTVMLLSVAVWVAAQLGVRDLLWSGWKDNPYIEPGPFDLLAWQLLWIIGLFLGQRYEKQKAGWEFPVMIQPVLIPVAIAFLICRWGSHSLGLDLTTQTWLLDKWHLGPLRLINFLATGWLIVRFGKRLGRWEVLFRPLVLVARHMLPIFCTEICLSILLIGVAEKGLEPFVSALVVCQLVSVFLIAWFLECRSKRKEALANSGSMSPAKNSSLGLGGRLLHGSRNG